MARRGLTLVEVLVSMAVIALLMALLIPAAQATRGAARSSQCRSNLRQLILAVANYESQHSIYPEGAYSKRVLLPYLDLSHLGGVRVSTLPFDHPKWSELGKLKITVYRCPADDSPDFVSGDAADNYPMSYGSGLLVGGLDGAFGYWGHFYPGYAVRPVRPSDLVDGTTTTAGISEWLPSNGMHARLRVRWETPASYSQMQVAVFQGICESLPADPSANGWLGNALDRGRPWHFGSFGVGQYNHMLPPNRPSCNNQTHLPSGIHTAGSQHLQGVHTAFMDGHVGFINESVDRRVWQRLGSRNDKAAGL